MSSWEGSSVGEVLSVLNQRSLSKSLTTSWMRYTAWHQLEGTQIFNWVGRARSHLLIRSIEVREQQRWKKRIEKQWIFYKPYQDYINIIKIHLSTLYQSILVMCPEQPCNDSSHHSSVWLGWIMEKKTCKPVLVYKERHVDCPTSCWDTSMLRCRIGCIQTSWLIKCCFEVTRGKTGKTERTKDANMIRETKMFQIKFSLPVCRLCSYLPSMKPLACDMRYIS